MGPILLTFNWERLLKKDLKGWWNGKTVQQNQEDNNLTVHQIMENDELKKELKAFCIKEFSTENYYFMQEVKQFKTLKNRDEMMKKIETMISTFIYLMQ